MTLGDNPNTDMPADLAKAIEAFVGAGREYRLFIKRNYPDRLRGAVFAECEGGELVLYSENARWTEAIKATVGDKSW